MAEKKVLKKITERLKRFEDYEQKCATRILTIKNDYNFDEEILELTRSIRGIDYVQNVGDLAVLYSTFMKYAEEVPLERRLEPEELERKYTLYIDAVKNKREYPRGFNNPDNYIQREALFIVVDKHNDGEERYSDYFNAKMMIDDCGTEIRYCAPWKKWVIWDGRRWKVDNENLIYQMAMDTVRGMYNKALEFKTGEETLSMIEHAGRSETVRKTEAMIRTTGWEKKINIVPDKLDGSPLIFNCRNGMIDLYSGRLIPHEKERMITKVSPVAYDPEAECPLWKKFLKEIFGKNKDLINFIQRALGWALTGDTSSQAMFILYGNGANGKST
ncbi:MAG: hypothetical protein KAR21_18535, partial [Spirochaetales bacterium]|nr:hypothetical protein [Spirochaetales bacterium]